MKLSWRPLGDVSFSAVLEGFPLTLWFHLCFNVCSLLIRREIMYHKVGKERFFSVKATKEGDLRSACSDCWWKYSSWAYGFVWGDGFWACEPSWESQDDISGCDKASYEYVMGMISISTFRPPERCLFVLGTREAAGSGYVGSRGWAGPTGLTAQIQ